MEEVALKITVEGGDKAQQSVKSIKQELREAKAAAAAAEEGTKEYLDAVSRAAVAADKLNDVNDAVKALNPGDKAAAFGTLFNTIAGGIQTITGLYGLFGDKSEEVEKILLRVQSAAALANGIQSLVEAQKQWGLLKEAISQSTLIKKIDEAATKSAAVTQRAFGVAVDTTSTSFKSLKGAIVATGVGALLVGIGFVIEKMMSWTETTDKQSESQENLSTMVNNTIQDLDQYTNALDRASKVGTKSIQNQIDLAKAQGKSAKEINALFNKLTDEQLARIDKIKVANESVLIGEFERPGNILKDVTAISDRILVVTKDLQDATFDLQLAKDSNDAANISANQSEVNRLSNILKAYQNYYDLLLEEDDLNTKRTIENTNFRNEAKDKEIERLKLIEKEIKDNNEAVIKGVSDFYKAQDDTNKAVREAQDKALEDYENYLKDYANLSKQAASDEIDLAEERTANAIATENAIREAKLAIAENTVNGLVALGQLFINDQKKLTKFNKVATLAGIALDTARAIASSIAGAAQAATSKGPGAPFALIAYITSGITAVLAGMAAAKKALQEPAINQVGGAAGGAGGTTGGFSAPQIQSPEQQFNIPAQANDFIKVFVTETDITNTQQGVQNNKKKAILTL